MPQQYGRSPTCPGTDGPGMLSAAAIEAYLFTCIVVSNPAPLNAAAMFTVVEVVTFIVVIVNVCDV